MENNNVDEKELESDPDEMNSVVDQMKSVVDEQEIESDDEEEMESDFDEKEELENNNDSIHTATQYLQETHWDLEDAIKLFFRHQEVSYLETLNEKYNNVAANIRSEMEHPDAVLAVDNSQDNDDNLPIELLYHGSFHETKQVVETQDLWLIVYVQSKDVFDSHVLNMHTWAHEAVSQTIDANFIFWQVYDNITKGQKACNYYKLTSFPAILVLDPITGQKMKSWSGMIEAVQLLEDLAPFMDAGPKYHHVQLCRKRPTETSQHTTIPKTTEEDEEVLLALLASMGNMTSTLDPACSDADKPTTSSSKNVSNKNPPTPDSSTFCE
ncbi:hypothetical protein MKW98_008354 [Papaver atlanticum]|uniref:UAS domain-containing protein n=1 Tax=Papaver atlanticum TaxID=357466 RepID=A0AAD4XCJ8_9MAGN|nr:hypothetical protein MKW98_008354 [Papaver atlanticum]